MQSYAYNEKGFRLSAIMFINAFYVTGLLLYP